MAPVVPSGPFCPELARIGHLPRLRVCRPCPPPSDAPARHALCGVAADPCRHAARRRRDRRGWPSARPRTRREPGCAGRGERPSGRRPRRRRGAQPAAPGNAARRHRPHGPAPVANRPTGRPTETARTGRLDQAAKPAAKSRSCPHRRYVPTGTGMWLYEWGRSNAWRRAAHRGTARAVNRALDPLPAHRLVLRRLHRRQPSAAAAGQRPGAPTSTSIAWDFPRVASPRARRAPAGHAAHPGPDGLQGLHVAAVAPDIETPAEGTFNAGWRVRLYLRALRRFLPGNVSILTAVPWPSRYADRPLPLQARCRAQ